ncbi:MAG: 2OG-Fe(II) oxygenase [Sphingomicrobium sp.]
MADANDEAERDAQSLPYYEPSIPFAEQRCELRGSLSTSVAESLDHAPGTWRFSSRRDRPIQLYIREQFVSEAECGALMALIDSGSYPSPLFEKNKYAGVRTSQSCNLDPYDPLVAQVDARLARLVGIDRSFGEPLQGQRYDVGQEFRDHADFFYIDQPYWLEYEPHGGQRTWTAMVFLGEPERGGATRFPLLDLDIQPVAGRLLVWNNMMPDGSPNPWTLHAGTPVEGGTKYIVTKWYRERTFC